MSKGTIFSVKRFEIHDGPGIRTTVFLKGCPLRCQWCHNPEGMLREIQKNFLTGKNFGRTVSAAELLPELLADRMFYGEEGGVTLSGGEPTLQPEFALELLELLKNEGIRTAVDTSLFVSRDVLERFLPLTDIFLTDVKAFDEERHRELTGVSNRSILENLHFLDENAVPYEVRIPLIPDKNEDQMEDIGRFLSGLKNVGRIRLLKYHDLGRSKYEALSLPYPMGEAKLPEERYEAAYEKLKAFGLNVIHR